MRNLFYFLPLCLLLLSCSSSTSSDSELDLDPLFTEGDGITDIDGNSYRTIRINGQEWMTENLKTTKYKNGDDIPNVPDDEDWVEILSGARSLYENDVENLDKFGWLYNWSAIADSRGLCPEGWVVPTNDQFTQFINGIGTENTVVHTLRVRGSDIWDGGNATATNTSGFSALPGGARLGGEFRDIGRMASWWTRTEGDQNEAALSWRIVYEQLTSQYLLINSNATKISGFNVRCIKE